MECGAHAKCKPDGLEALCICDDGWTYDPVNVKAGCVGE